MITDPLPRHHPYVPPTPTATWDGESPVGDPLIASAPLHAEEPVARAEAQTRVESMVHSHYRLVWRLLRWLGVPRNELDDVTQDVFWLASQRMDQIRLGSEWPYLFGVALRKAASARRAASAYGSIVDLEHYDAAASLPLPDQQMEQGQARELLYEVLQGMSEDSRLVFALFELEELEITEIARLLEIPVGTVGSRLRRAREEFSREARRVRARVAFQGRER